MAFLYIDTHTHAAAIKPNRIRFILWRRSRQAEKQRETSNIGFIMPLDVFGRFLSIPEPWDQRRPYYTVTIEEDYFFVQKLTGIWSVQLRMGMREERDEYKKIGLPKVEELSSRKA